MGAALATTTFQLASDVATNGTFTVGNPSNAPGNGGRGPWANGVNAKISMIDGGMSLSAPNDFTCVYAATAVTVTYLGATTLKAGWRGIFQWDAPGADFDKLFRTVANDYVTPMYLSRVLLGMPAVSAANDICLAQAIAGAANAVIAGAYATNGVATLDVPRNVQLLSTSASDTGTFFVVITGTDVYGVAMTEKIAFNGTSVVPGLKAFKKITKVAVSAALTGNLTLGSNTAVGIPVHLPNASCIVGELIDGVKATAGTTVVGLVPTTKSTNATADVRGTYIPNSAGNSSRVFELILALSDPYYLGNPQA